MEDEVVVVVDEELAGMACGVDDQEVAEDAKRLDEGESYGGVILWRDCGVRDVSLAFVSAGHCDSDEAKRGSCSR